MSNAPDQNMTDASISIAIRSRPSAIPPAIGSLPKKPAKRGRDDEDEQPSSKDRALAIQLSNAESAWNRWLEAYRGDHQDALEGDAPKDRNLLNAKRCVLIFSDGEKSFFVQTPPEERISYQYVTFSQNASIEIIFGKVLNTSAKAKDAKTSHLASLDISTEQMQKIMVYNSINQVDANTLRSGLASLISTISSTDAVVTQMLNLVTGNSKEKNVDCITFDLKPSSLWFRKPDECVDRDAKMMVLGFLEPQIQAILKVTVLRAAVPDNTRFVDRFWTEQMTRCLEKGIYWGYDLDRLVPPPAGFKEDMHYVDQVLRGFQPPPFLPWARGKQLAICKQPFRSYMTSIKEWSCINIIGLLDEVNETRKQAVAVYSFQPSAARHVMIVEQDSEAPSHWFLHVKAGHAARIDTPVVPQGVTFKVRQVNKEGSDLGLAALECTSVQLVDGAVADLMLEIDLTGQALPWNNEWKHGATFNVLLEMDVNIAAALRSLASVRKMADSGPKALQQLFIGRPSVLVSSNNFSKALNLLKTKRPAESKDLECWALAKRTNCLQQGGIDLALANQYTFIQGPPGSGKSVVIVKIAVQCASVGMHVVIGAPTNEAGKSNAAKLAEEWSELPASLQKRMGVVYLTTWSDTFALMYENAGYKAKLVTRAVDKPFEKLQFWYYIKEYAAVQALMEKKDERADRFLDIWAKLEKASQTGIVLEDVEIKEFEKAAKLLGTDFLKLNSKSMIIITTCNNAAILMGIDITFGMLLLEEAGIAVDYDATVLLQLKHKQAVIVGDHLQLTPVVLAKSGVMSQFMEKSLLERILRKPEQPRTKLLIVYRFPAAIADAVGILGGYEGLASGAPDVDETNLSVKKWWTKAGTEFARSMIIPPSGSRFGTVLERKQTMRRIALSVPNARSSPPLVGSSSVNYAFVNAGIKVLKSLVNQKNSGVNASDIAIICAHDAQAKAWRSQIKIQWEDAAKHITILTGGVSQGREYLVIIADPTIANTQEPAFLGFLRTWNRMNVMGSRGKCLLIWLINWDLMRPKLEAIYKQSKTWAYFLLDLIDSGEVCLLPDAPNRFPKDAEEFARYPKHADGRIHWTDIQPASDSKTLPASATAKPQNLTGASSLGGRKITKYTDLEKRYLQEFNELRAKADANVMEVLEENALWQKQREAEQKIETDAMQLDEDAKIGLAGTITSMGNTTAESSKKKNE